MKSASFDQCQLPINSYAFDHRVRWLNKFDDPDNQPYSIAEIPTQGLTPLDLAAMQHDPFIFDVLLRLGKKIDINTVDEEGFGVLHRMSCKPEGRTRAGTAFSTLPFRGSQQKADEDLKRTIVAIKALGGDLEQLTRPAAPKAQEAQGNWEAWNLSRCTPLMLAFLSASPKVMQALLECGSNVHTENNLGETASHCLPALPQDMVSSGKCARLLISYSANANYKHTARAGLILKAAQNGLLDVVEGMLCAGADIDERERNPKSLQEGSNVFAFLARVFSPDIDGEDVLVARLLQTYVFSCPDVKKRRRVVEVGDRDGETLLHCFAMRCMPYCVELLLKKGAPVNARRKKLKIAPDSKNGGVRSSWDETPLDTAREYQVYREERMTKFLEWSVETCAKLVKRHGDIVAMVEKAGGLLTREVVVKKQLCIQRARRRASKIPERCIDYIRHID